ncbi:CBS domain-containing protein [Amycolatopsis xylanica]|uniref:CBS domain-containing protein n=1 Tax=Amycolatopsis xylanica TaxID=589385 RepID=A0A1H3H722_9PSEU|nr:CBS domain-containing protein [Amycolatopsis xylanica]SDY11025.1 CBS domain-containing protein [Amycolatopsis xylanica]
MDEPTVAELTDPRVITLELETPFKHVVGLMIAHDRGALPVIDPAGHPLGVVTETDVLPKLEFHAGAEHPPLLSGSHYRARWHKARALTAGDVMTKPAITTTPDTPLSTAVAILSTRQVSQLCVLDYRGTLIGLLNRQDTLRQLLRHDETIRTDVEHILATTIPGAHAVTIGVTDGIVTLEGTFPLRSNADHAVHLAHHIPGVVAVRDHLRYDADDLMITGF